MLSRIARAIFVGRPPRIESRDEHAISNYALALAQEWGKDWLKPIQSRLHEAYPNLSEEELNRLNSLAQAAMRYGHDLVYSMAEKGGRKNLKEDDWRTAYVARYPWVNEKNLRHLFSTGMYYAWKDGME